MYGSEMQPKLVFGEGEDLDLFLNAAKLVAPEAYDLRNILINSWKPFTKAHNWTMPDRGVVHKRVWNDKAYKVQEPLLGSSFTFNTSINEGKERGVSLAADVVHSLDGYLLRELNRRCNFNTIDLIRAQDIIANRRCIAITDRTKLMSLVEVNYLTEENVNEYTDNQLGLLNEQIEASLRFGSFEVVNIHDEFKCHANHMNKLRKHYNQILWEMYHSNIMADIIFEISGKILHTLPFEQNVADAILQGSYAIN